MTKDLTPDLLDDFREDIAKGGTIHCEAWAVGALVGEIERLRKAHIESECQLREWQDRCARAESAHEPKPNAINPRDCTHAHLVDDKDQPGVNVYYCQICHARINVIEFQVHLPCTKATESCPNCFGDKTITMSDGSKRACEYCQVAVTASGQRT